MQQHYYKNKTSRLQTINTGQRTLYVPERAEVELHLGEEQCMEIKALIRGNSPRGALRTVITQVKFAEAPVTFVEVDASVETKPQVSEKESAEPALPVAESPAETEQETTHNDVKAGSRRRSTTKRDGE